MTFTELKKFITEDMSMSHIYQPVMLIELLKQNGKASVKDIAQAILNHDPTQVDYYSEIVKNMVGKVLTKNRGITEKEKDTYLLGSGSKWLVDLSHFTARLCSTTVMKFSTIGKNIKAVLNIISIDVTSIFVS